MSDDKAPNVWRIVEGEERLADGSTRRLRFSIQEVPRDRREEALEHMLKYFIVDEPICKSLNVKDDPKMIHDFRILWNHCLDQGIVEAAYIIDSDNKTRELAAINMLGISSDEEDSKLGELEKKFQSPKFKRVMQIMVDITKKADARTICGVDKYISAFGLNVLPNLRGQKLGLRMLEARTEIGKKYGIPASSTVFTAPASQILASRAGFKEELVLDYASILTDEGEPFFPNIESKDMKVMMKRLY